MAEKDRKQVIDETQSLEADMIPKSDLVSLAQRIDSQALELDGFCQGMDDSFWVNNPLESTVRELKLLAFAQMSAALLVAAGEMSFNELLRDSYNDCSDVISVNNRMNPGAIKVRREKLVANFSWNKVTEITIFNEGKFHPTLGGGMHN